MNILNVPKSLNSWEADRISTTISLLLSHKQGFVRGDYKELIKLAQIYYRDTAPVENVMKLIRPGACHRARWMAKIIYACKVVFLSDSDQRANTKILSRGKRPKVERFLRFVMYVYLPWWLTAPVASRAPVNDLELINKLLTCREVDYAMAKKVMDKLKNHLWYLVEEMAPLSLFSPIVSEDMKDRIVKKMLTYPTTDVTRSVTGYGKPGNPPCLTQLTNT